MLSRILCDSWNTGTRDSLSVCSGLPQPWPFEVASVWIFALFLLNNSNAADQRIRLCNFLFSPQLQVFTYWFLWIRLHQSLRALCGLSVWNLELKPDFDWYLFITLSDEPSRPARLPSSSSGQRLWPAQCFACSAIIHVNFQKSIVPCWVLVLSLLTESNIHVHPSWYPKRCEPVVFRKSNDFNAVGFKTVLTYN